MKAGALSNKLARPCRLNQRYGNEGVRVRVWQTVASDGQVSAAFYAGTCVTKRAGQLARGLPPIMRRHWSQHEQSQFRVTQPPCDVTWSDGSMDQIVENVRRGLGIGQLQRWLFHADISSTGDFLPSLATFEHKCLYFPYVEKKTCLLLLRCLNCVKDTNSVKSNSFIITVGIAWSGANWTMLLCS